MKISLKNHPFSVEAHFERSTILTFAVPKEKLEHLIPECLELDTFQNTWAFIAVALVKTKQLRPKGFPKLLGKDFFLTGYRVFVRYKTSKGKCLRGLYILKSETDKKQMAFFGNLFTHYNYTTTDIIQNEEIILSYKSQIKIELDSLENKAIIPKDSPFFNWKEARRFAGPLPFTFTYNEKTNEVLIIQGIRQNWKPKPINIKSHQIGFLKSIQVEDAILASTFIIEEIPYNWKKGKTDIWKQKEENFKAS